MNFLLCRLLAIWCEKTILPVKIIVVNKDIAGLTKLVYVDSYFIERQSGRLF